MAPEAARNVALNLVLGSEGASRIEMLRQRLRDAGLPASDVPAHVTIAVLEHGDPAALAAAFSGPPPTTLHVVHPGIFLGPPAVAFVGVAPTIDLVRLHERTWAALNGLGEGWAHYEPGGWVPHCTLAMPLEAGDVGQAMIALVGAQLPFAVDVTELAVADLETGATLFSPWP